MPVFDTDAGFFGIHVTRLKDLGVSEKRAKIAGNNLMLVLRYMASGPLRQSGPSVA
jgi:hypothetical protein